MSCHSQIWTNSPLLEPVRASYVKQEPLKWNRLHSVPDFVYFNHSIHINRGINCNICHGPIQKEMIAYKGKPFWMVMVPELPPQPGKLRRQARRCLRPLPEIPDLSARATKS